MPPKAGLSAPEGPCPAFRSVASQPALEVSSCRVGGAEALQGGRERRGYLVQAPRNFRTLHVEGGSVSLAGAPQAT